MSNDIDEARSPLLADILLDDLDKEPVRRGLQFVRYTDDMVILISITNHGAATAHLPIHIRLI